MTDCRITVITYPNMDNPASLLIVDDDEFNRAGLRAYLATKGYTVSEAGDEASALAIAQQQPIAVAVVDISIPPTAAQRVKPSDSYGLSLARTLKQTQPAIGVVLFSAYEDRGEDVMQLIKAGHRSLGYKLKGCSPSDLLRAIQEVQAGRVVIDAEVTQSRVHTLVQDMLGQLSSEEREPLQFALDHLDELTSRERDIAYRIAASQTVKGVAEALHLAPKTIENTITTIYSKLGLNMLPTNLREVVLLAKACLMKDLMGKG